MNWLLDMVVLYKIFKFWDGYLMDLEFFNSKIRMFRIEDFYFFS